MNKKIVYGGILIAIVIAIVALFLPSVSTPSSTSLGSGTPGTRFPHGITVGGGDGSSAFGTNMAVFLDGTCALIVQGGNVTASTTGAYDCAVTGLTSSYNVRAIIATSTKYASGQGNGFYVVGAKASTTAGYLTVILANGTGADANPSVMGYASSTAYQAILAQ